jgi:hypothetical protein
MPWTFNDVPEAVQKLEPDMQVLWVETANKALDDGYDDGSAIAIAWSVVNKAIGANWYPAIYMSYPLLRPGNYELAKGGTLAVTADTLNAVHEAIGRLYNLGQPVSLVPGHGATWTVGIIPAARISEDVLYGCLVYDDGYKDGVTTGAYGLSIEAYRKYVSEAYTDGKEFELWPTSWAILGADEQPACPPGVPLIAAKEGNAETVTFAVSEPAPIRGNEPQGKEAVEMDELRKELDALKVTASEQAAKITALEAAEKELTGKLQTAEQERDALKAAETQRQADVKAGEVKGRFEKIMAAEQRPGNREKLQMRYDEALTVEDKERFVTAAEAVIEAVQLPEQVLHAADHKPTEDNKDKYDTVIEAAEKMAHDEKIPYDVALARVTMKEGD